MFKNISIIGDGAMATVMAILLCEKNKPVRMWGYDRRQLSEIAQQCENIKFLPGYKLPQILVFEPNDERIMAGADLIVSAVPCQFVRQVWKRLKDYVPDGVPIVSTAKGIENDTLLRPTQILADVLGEKRDTRYAVLSGPTIADELARKLPATACAAASDEQLAKYVQSTFNCSWLRVYSNTDVVGVELAAACKNIIAIAAGIIDGTGAGDNAKAALLCRGLAEITRLGIACGARPQTFAGLTGLGDLVTTCISPKGRNRSFGERIGKGQTVDSAQRATESVIEGIATCKSVIALAEQYDVEMPITQAIYEVLFEDKPVQKAIDDLMRRRLNLKNITKILWPAGNSFFEKSKPLFEYFSFFNFFFISTLPTPLISRCCL
ncbi:MAG: NAD(P)H-dependent glycerol-3-phosphate dehydrogenase [Planctomycetota bacterium]|jgi:glycerol-3-phosphate dehydrogenase (NAD(P)+)